MEVYAIAGSKFLIGPHSQIQKRKVTLADFSGVSFTEVGSTTTFPDIGDEQSLNEQEIINDSRVIVSKGTRNAPTAELQYVPDGLDEGQALIDEAGEQQCGSYPVKVEYGALCTPSGTVTISSADPAVVTWDAHGLVADQPVIFSTTGALPTGLTAGTVYYVRTTGLTADTFTVSATKGGAAVATTAAGAGTHTASAPPVGKTLFFHAIFTPVINNGGGANDNQLATVTLKPVSNIIKV